MRPTHRLAALLVAVVAFVLPAAAHAAEGDSLLLSPAEGSPLHPDGGWFAIEAMPGDSVEHAVALRNDSADPTTVQLGAVDATTASLGGVAYGDPEEERRATATWITLSQSLVELAPGEAAIVAFTVTVPADARGGQHLAGIAAWAPEADAETVVAEEGQAGASIVVRTRQVVAVQVDLPGGVGPQLEIEGVEVLARPDGLYLGLQLANTGSEMLTATGQVTLPAGTTRRVSVDTFVPGTSVVYPLRWTESIDEGTYPIAVELSYAGTTTTFAGDVVVGEAIQEELADRQIGVEDAGPFAARSTLWLVVLAAAALLVVGLIAVLVRGRKVSLPRTRPVSRRSATSDQPTGWSTTTSVAPQPPRPTAGDWDAPEIRQGHRSSPIEPER